MKLAELPRVGPKTLALLAKLGLHSVEDLLLHLPLRYEDRTRLTPLAEIPAGTGARFCVQLIEAKQQFGGRRSLRLAVRDDSGEAAIRLFHFRREQLAQYQPGSWWLCWGELREGRWGRECVHPQMQAVPGPQALPELGRHLTPVYPSTQGLGQARWLSLMERALPKAEDLFPELVQDGPEGTVAQALRCLHRPPVDRPERMHAARQRLAFEELLAQRLAVLRGRARLSHRQARACAPDAALLARWKQALPFVLTPAQKQVLEEVQADLNRNQPMLRLVQGDVGAGKTVIAAGAALQVLGSGGQVALMAPTEILARQHAATLAAWLEPLGFAVVLLTGAQTAAQKREALAQLESDAPLLVVGTQALFQEPVRFAGLGLVLVDEQHRFGVGQRLALRDKGGEFVAHQLILTATPIPRTLAQTIYADLDVSQMSGLPPGRQPVQTVAMAQSRRPEVVQRLGAVCADGAQAFWVCPALSETDFATAAEDILELLRGSLPHLQIGLLHGQLKGPDKLAVMQDFREGKLAILVATTVIEVGVDVPNATIIIIDEAERLGLAQLHQLRGRVGRGSAQSYCVLLYKPPLAETARARLQALCEIQDGFALAEADLELRGPGELLGTAQSGEQRLRFADALFDTALLPQVVRSAENLLRTRPELAATLVRRWLGQKADYAEV